VDIDEFAVNVARLRLWLSLAVEFEGETPPPLPNLDYKVEAGDSICSPTPSGLELGLRKTLIDDYLSAKAEYMKAHHSRKLELRQTIAKLRADIATWAHREADDFDWPLEFAEVFTEGGFDVVLTNPPYVRQELITDLKPALKEVFPAVYTGTSDLYTYFYARGLELLRSGGMLAFISSNKWFRANYGARLRQHIAKTCAIRSITDFGDLPVFKSATSYPMIFVAQKDGKSETPALFTQVKSLEPPYPDVLAIIREHGERLPPQSIAGPAWTLADASSVARFKKMEAAGVPLGEYVKGRIYRGVLTGLNKAFVIDGAKRAELISLSPKSAEIIKPLAVGDDIRKWRIEKKDRWLIFTRRGVDINAYPAIKKHLAQWRTELEPKPDDWDGRKEWPGRKPGSYKWYEIQDEIAYYAEFDKPKIVWGNLGLEPAFSFSADPLYIMAPANIIPTSDHYLLGLLNSSTSKRFFDETSIQRGGNYLEFKPVYVKQLPIPDAPAAERAGITALVQKCLDAKGIGCEKWEAEINERVAALYGL
jgi:hypothetical protein